VSQSIPFALPADVARADGDVLVSSEGLVSSEDLRRGGGGIKARPHDRYQGLKLQNNLGYASAPCYLRVIPGSLLSRGVRPDR
jgi:hypothetical protein